MLANKIGYSCSQVLSYTSSHRYRNSVPTTLIFLHLLEADTDSVAQVTLRHASFPAQKPNAFADFNIYGLWAFRRVFHKSTHLTHLTGDSRGGPRPDATN